MQQLLLFFLVYRYILKLYEVVSRASPTELHHYAKSNHGVQPLFIVRIVEPLVQFETLLDLECPKHCAYLSKKLEQNRRIVVFNLILMTLT